MRIKGKKCNPRFRKNCWKNIPNKTKRVGNKLDALPRNTNKNM